MKKLIFIESLLCLFFFIGCATTSVFSGTGDLCGIVIDENNQPVEGVMVSCKRNNGIWKKTITNEEGLFVFPDSDSGTYSFTAEKENYQILTENKCLFTDRNKMFCLRINSVDEAANLIEEKILCGDYEEAVGLMKQIKGRKNKEISELFNCYEECIAFLKGEKNE